MVSKLMTKKILPGEFVLLHLKINGLKFTLIVTADENFCQNFCHQPTITADSLTAMLQLFLLWLFCMNCAYFAACTF